MTRQVFVIMPFKDKAARDIYKLSTKPICEEFSLEVVRADEILTPNAIIDDITFAIQNSTVIIADLSGRNANVFYELGMAHLLRQKQTIMITHDDFGKLPFDVSHLRVIKYQNTIAGKASYESQLRETLQNILRDYKHLFKEEFTLVLTVFGSSNDTLTDLYALIGLSKLNKHVNPNERLIVEGHKQNKSSAAAYGYSYEIVERFEKLEYIKISADNLTITDKGKAFVEFLEENQLVCDFVNGKVLSDGFEPLLGDEYSKMLKKERNLRGTYRINQPRIESN